jgi:hypothetical protein
VNFEEQVAHPDISGRRSISGNVCRYCGREASLAFSVQNPLTSHVLKAVVVCRMHESPRYPIPYAFDWL